MARGAQPWQQQGSQVRGRRCARGRACPSRRRMSTAALRAGRHGGESRAPGSGPGGNAAFGSEAGRSRHAAAANAGPCVDAAGGNLLYVEECRWAVGLERSMRFPDARLPGLPEGIRERIMVARRGVNFPAPQVQPIGHEALLRALSARERQNPLVPRRGGEGFARLPHSERSPARGGVQ